MDCYYFDNFVISNTAFLAVWATTLIGQTSRGMTQSLSNVIIIGGFFATPLNSTIYPIVYLTRRSDMRGFFQMHLECRN